MTTQVEPYLGLGLLIGLLLIVLPWLSLLWLPLFGLWLLLVFLLLFLIPALGRMHDAAAERMLNQRHL
jgi:hypothetical protein